MNTIYALALVQNTMTTGLEIDPEVSHSCTNLNYRFNCVAYLASREGLRRDWGPVFNISVESHPHCPNCDRVCCSLRPRDDRPYRSIHFEQQWAVCTARSRRPHCRYVEWRQFHFIEFARADIPNQGIVFTLMTVRLAMRSSKTLMTTTVRTGGGFPIEWRVRGSTTVATTEFGPTTLGTAGTTDIQVKSVEFGGSQSDQEAESQQVKETKDSP